MTVPLVVIAMEAEAAPVRTALGLDGHGEPLHPAFPARLWAGADVAVAVNGADPRFGVDSIASQPAVTTALHAIEAVQPSIVISAGTAGGFATRGGEITSTYVADLTHIAEQLGFETGTVTSGNALDAPVEDMVKMHGTDAVAKDMEAAAVAWMCERLEVPFTALKVITDLVDTEEEAAEQFSRNLKRATARLAEAVPAFVAALG